MPTRYGSISLKKGIWKDSTYPNGVEITKIVEDGVTVWHKDYVGLTYTKLEDHSYSIRAEDTSISGDIKIYAVYYFKSGLATSIENKGFYNCNNITSVDIYSGIESIGNEAFASCDKLKYVIMPTSVTYIGTDAFLWSSVDIYYKGFIDEWNNFILGFDDYTQSILKNRTYVYAGSNASHPLPGGGTDADTLPAPDGFKGYWYYDENEVPATLCNYYADDGVVNFTIEETLKPTCDERGYNTWTCNDCGKQWYEYIEPLGHDYSEYVVAPTCTERGYTLHMCWNCQESYEDNYTDALGHSYGDWTVTLDPTCTTAGSKRRTCTRAECNAYEELSVAATGHTWVNATCISPKTCKVCGATTGSALGHIEVIDHAVLPTCTEKGLSEGKHCSRCGTTLVPQTTMQPLGHIWADATCTTPQTCTVCGSTTGSALGHSYGEWTVTLQPTCTTKGSKRRTCTRTGCDAYEDSTVAAKGHKYSSVVKSPTCTEQGYTTHTCSCGESYVDTYTDALGHKWSTWTIVSKPTCTEAGSNRRTCSVCDASEAQMVAAKGHTWVAATCTTPKTCSVCKATEGSALGHTWVAATCTTPKTCSTCGATEGSATGHSWSNTTYIWASDYSTCTASRGCWDCSKAETANGRVAYTVTQAPTATSTGTGTYTATFTSSLDWALTTQTKTVTIPKLEIVAPVLTATVDGALVKLRMHNNNSTTLTCVYLIDAYYGDILMDRFGSTAAVSANSWTEKAADFDVAYDYYKITASFSNVTTKIEVEGAGYVEPESTSTE